MEIITPYKDQSGITFYISNDGTETGISVRGLERLLGFSERGSLFGGKNKLMEDCQLDTPRESIPESLQTVWGKVFNRFATGSDGAKIVRSEAMLAIIEYYAFERNNDVAKHSFRSIAKLGADSWIKEITGFAVNNETNKIQEKTEKLIGKIDGLLTRIEKIEQTEALTVTIYPGISHITEGLSNSNFLMLENKTLYTAKEWLESKGFKLTHGDYVSFGHLVAQTYKTLTGKDPKIKYKTTTYKGKPKKIKDGWGYQNIDYYIMEAAFEKFKVRLTK